jgi:uncharacterized protein with ParB-like and HNH nuclease domain
MQDGSEKIPEELAALGEKSGVQQEINEDSPQEPFDPGEISIISKNISLDAILRRIKSGTIQLSPDFQRNVVWDNKRKSLLIESLMLNIPIAMFYVSDDGKGNWEVVDGLQRLTAIKEFVLEKKFKLSDLEFWKQYNDSDMDDLPPFPYNQIMETEFSFVIIQPTTRDAVKYNIFKRINTGGLPLSNQEIRHALYQGEGTKILNRLSISEEFLMATDHSINDSRMVAREVILRCLSFMILGVQGYLPNDAMDSFLNKGIRILNNLEPPFDKKLEKDYGETLLNSLVIKDYKTLTDLFLLGMKRNLAIFEENAFRISSWGYPRSPINKSLFEIWGGLFATISEKKYKALLEKKDILISEYDKTKREERFSRAVSRDSWKKQNVDYRFKTVSDLVRRILDDNKS